MAQHSPELTVSAAAPTLGGQPLLFNSYKELFRAPCQLYYPDIINKIPFQSGLASCRPNRQLIDRKPGSYDGTAVLEADLGTSHCPGVGNPHHKQNGSFPQVLQPRCEQTLFGITLNSAPTLDSNFQMTKQNSGNKFPVLMEAIQQKRSFPRVSRKACRRTTHLRDTCSPAEFGEVCMEVAL